MVEDNNVLQISTNSILNKTEKAKKLTGLVVAILSKFDVHRLWCSLFVSISWNLSPSALSE